MMAATDPSTCHVTQLMAQNHHVSRCPCWLSCVPGRLHPCHMGGGGPAHFAACTCLGELRELPARPKHKILVGHSGETKPEPHLYPRHTKKRREGTGRDKLCVAERSEQLVISWRCPLKHPDYTMPRKPYPPLNCVPHPASHEPM